MRQCFVHVLGCSAFLVGCASESVTSQNSTSTQHITMERPQFAAAFDAAVATVEDMGMPPEVEDRDGGVIETRPRVSGSLIEPWIWPANSVAEATEATITFQRRRARIEFLPVGFRPTAVDESAPLLGSRTPSTVDANAGGGVLLSEYDGPLELRVAVFIERAFTPGLQRSTWTLSEVSFSTNPLRPRPPSPTTTYDLSVWTPIERDPVLERALLTAIRERMATPLEQLP